VELAAIFQRYGPAYRTKYAAELLPSHLAAMQAIEQCRSAALGGEVYYCDGCQQHHYVYRSCGNRHCPKCQHQAGEEWLAAQQGLLLQVPYFLVTFTLPAGLRALIRSNCFCQSESASIDHEKSRQLDGLKEKVIMKKRVIRS
jgi:hypothetical protein